MIGYNVEKINELLKSVANSYNSIGEAMATGWSTVRTTLQSEWVGPDEISFQNGLAKRVQELYVDCKDAVDDTITNIKKIGESWRDFQEGNVLSKGTLGIGGSSISKDAIADMVIPALKEYPVSKTVKSDETKTFSASTNLGLTNGTQSGTNIQKAVKTYVENIHTKVKTLYEGLDSSSAFLGNKQSKNIDAYLSKVGAGLGKLTSCMQDLYDALANLASKNYGDSETTVGTTASKAEVNFDYESNNIVK